MRSGSNGRKYMDGQKDSQYGEIARMIIMYDYTNYVHIFLESDSIFDCFFFASSKIAQRSCRSAYIL